MRTLLTAALERVFSRQSLNDHPREARTIVCFPNTLARVDAGPDNSVIDSINAALGSKGHCSERVESPELDQYYVYGPSLGAMTQVLSDVCRSTLRRPDAYFLCTDVDRRTIDEYAPLRPTADP